ncbi:MAG: response regulator [Planctomycetota bacterium]|jgi:CheY-like chemotaxis protein
MRHDASTQLGQLRLAFLEQATAQLDQLAAELEQSSSPTDEALRLSHNLRGTAGCYELDELHQAGSDLDDALRAGAEGAAVQRYLERARASVERAAVDARRAVAEVAESSAVVTSAKRVVAVEDDPSIGLLITKAVERMGCEVEWFDDGLRALERLQRGPAPDLLLLDLMLPSISGHDLAHALVRSESAGGTPIVVISAKPRAEVQRLTDELGLLGSLPKPFSIDDLNRVVRHALEAPRV